MAVKLKGEIAAINPCNKMYYFSTYRNQQPLNVVEAHDHTAKIFFSNQMTISGRGKIKSASIQKN